MSSSVLSHRSRLIALVRHRGPDDPAVVEARRDLAAAGLEDRIRRAVDATPSLSIQQRARLAALLLAHDGDAA